MKQSEQQERVFSHHRWRVDGEARELVRAVSRWPLENAERRRHASRAASSVALNIAEGAGVRGQGRNRHFRIALGSVVEVVAAYEIASDMGERARVEEVSARAYVVASMLGRAVAR